jgi:hypothetical protein
MKRPRSSANSFNLGWPAADQRSTAGGTAARFVEQSNVSLTEHRLPSLCAQRAFSLLSSGNRQSARLAHRQMSMFQYGSDRGQRRKRDYQSQLRQMTHRLIRSSVDRPPSPSLGVGRLALDVGRFLLLVMWSCRMLASRMEQTTDRLGLRQLVVKFHCRLGFLDVIGDALVAQQLNGFGASLKRQLHSA